jgi:hypothetical protein
MKRIAVDALKREKYDTCTKLTYFFQGSLSLMLKKEEKSNKTYTDLTFIKKGKSTHEVEKMAMS